MTQVIQHVQQQVEVDYDPFADGELLRVVPTTESQRELWLASHLGDDASLAFNESVSLRLSGNLDALALGKALEAVVAGHDALRASFGPDGETFCVTRAGSFHLEVTDLTALPQEAREARVQEAKRQGVDSVFALEKGQLFRAELLRLSGDDHLLVMNAHHIVCDGWSWWVIVRELGALYAQHCDGIVPAPLMAESYADYALDEASHPAGAKFKADQAYWLSRFADGAPVLDLPADRARPARRSFASRREDYVLDAVLVGAIRRMGARRGASLFATLLGGFAGLLSRLTGQSEVVIGIPAAGQSVDGHDDLVGHCVNLLPLRFDMDPAQPFIRTLDAAQETLLDALEHQRYTFGTLLKKLHIDRDPSRLPLVSVMFNIDQALDQEKSGFPGLKLEFTTNPRTHENFELSINAVQVQGELRLECQYHTDLFDAATIRRWLSTYEALLRSATENPDQLFSQLSLVDEGARVELQALQPVPGAFDRDCLMHEHFERQCDREPQRIAVRCNGEHLSYAELEARANRIAHRLRAAGVHRGSLVGLAVDRSTDMLAGMLAILKTGAGYVPLDPQFPAERLAYMAGDAGLAALVTQSKHAAHFDLRGRPILALDVMEAELAATSSLRLPRDGQAAQPESIAYVIYTSGSTGRPKGVQVPHRAVANFLESMAREPGMKRDDRLLAVTTLSFDIAVLELLLPLSVGGEVVLADKDSVIDGMALKELLDDSSATLMQATPATWRMLIEAGWNGHPDFRALCGGEPLSPDLATQLLARCGQLWNLYGPTETTVWSTCMQVVPPRGQQAPDIHIGRPIGNTQVWILDDHGKLCPRGVPGEICIGGDGVTLGYLDREALTAEKFLVDPFASVVPGVPPRLYRTGDRGRWRSDGNLEHMGRLDFQVKVRGYRIELGEIENSLATHSSVAHAVAMAREDRPGDVRLVAYVVPQTGGRIDAPAVLGHLRGTLPDYMIPQHLVVLDAIPLLPNGKIDRKALPVPHKAVATEGAPRTAPRDALETSVLAAMEAVLGRPGIGMDDGFFVLGGHSLLAAKLCAQLGQALGVQIPLRTVFDAPTAARLAATLRTMKLAEGHSEAALHVPPRVDRSRAPLTLQQQRLWFLEEMDPGRVLNNTPSAHRLRGPFDALAFERAFNEMLRRQESLRTTIVAGNDGAEQAIAPAAHLPLLPMQDLSTWPETERDSALMRELDRMVDTPFELDGSPLFVARLFRMGEQDHVLFFMTHHLIWDGWSFDLFYNEMSALYTAFSQGKPSPLAPLELSYGDFAAWQREWAAGDEVRKQVAYWTQHLSGTLEPLQLPEDRPRPVKMSGQAGTTWLEVDHSAANGLRSIGERHGATLFMTLLAAYYVLLHRLGDQQDIVVGLPMRNRNHVVFEKVMGFFVNMLPLRMSISPEHSFEQVLARVRDALLSAFSNPDVPFERLIRELHIKRDYSRSAIYQTLFSFQDVRGRPTRWGDLQHEHVLLFQRGISNDLGIWFLEHDQGLSGAVAYNSDILSAAAAERIVQQFRVLLEGVSRDPSRAVGSLELDEPGQAPAVAVKKAVSALDGAPVTSVAGAGIVNAVPIDPRKTQDPRIVYLAGLWRDMLGVCVEPGDNFFDLGGHSMLAMQMVSKVFKDTGVRIRLLPLATQTLGQVASELPEDDYSNAEFHQPRQRDELAVEQEGRHAPMPETAQLQVRAIEAGGWEPMFIGAGGHPLYAALHQSAPVSSIGVLLIPPLLHEQPRSRRFVSEIATCLADAGVPTLRFDFSGTGDSGGRGADMDFESMQHDIGTAMQSLRELTGVQRIALLAFRAATLPIGCWLAEGGQADALILWEPVTDGATWIDFLQRQDMAERVSLDRYPLGRWPNDHHEDNHLMGFAVGSRFCEQASAAHVAVDELPPGLDCIEIVRSDACEPLSAPISRRILLPEDTPAFGDTTRMNDALFISSGIEQIVKQITVRLRSGNGGAA